MNFYSKSVVSLGEYYISDGVFQFGPFDQIELSELIADGQVSVTDFVYDSQTKVWTKVFSFIDNLKKSNGNKLPSESVIVLGLEPDVLPLNQNFLDNLESVIEDKSKISDITKKTVQRWWVKEKLFVLGPYHYLSLLSLWKQGGIESTHLICEDANQSGVPANIFFKNEDVEKYTKLKSKKVTSTFSEQKNKRHHARLESEDLILVYSDTDCKIVQLYDLSPVSLSFFSVEDYFFREDELVCTIVDKNQKQHQFDTTVFAISKVEAIESKIVLKKYVLMFDEEISPDVFELFFANED